MRVFLTGGTGYIGGAVAASLRSNGHDVTALVRQASDSGALLESGAAVVNGDLEQLPELADVLAQHDVFIHTAFPYGDERAVDLDRLAIEALLAQNGRPAHFIYTSGVWILGNTTSANEDSAVNPLRLVGWRPEHERTVLDAATGGFTTTVLRPGCVYGGSQSLLKQWFAAAAEGSDLQVIGDGSNRWALVERNDLATLYRLAAERRVGGVLHGIDDTRLTLHEIAHSVVASSPKKSSSIRRVEPDEARKSMGPMVDALTLDQIVDSFATRARTGWQPTTDFGASINVQWQEWNEQVRV